MTEHNDPILDLLENAEHDGLLEIPPVKLSNGFIASQVYTQDNGLLSYQDGTHRFTGVVLGTRVQTKGFHDYATWSMWWDTIEQRWECNGGDYFDDLDLARFNFGLKLKRNCWGATLRALRHGDG